ncbi:MAG: RdgB/HAM1 family non-canonical purine NTP pyrophosphatase [Myxococcota bacterium]
MNKIILATSNKGKSGEIKDILHGLPVEVEDLSEINFDSEIEENGSTYLENALIKARVIYELYKEMVISDDSGLEVSILNNRPGIHSARYAPTTDERIRKLLKELDGVPIEKRGARFVCVACFMVSPEEYYLFEGTVNGIISTEPSGNNGFGFDPIFYLPEYKKTMAELPPDIKNRISHRGQAFEKLKRFLLDWHTGSQT